MYLKTYKKNNIFLIITILLLSLFLTACNNNQSGSKDKNIEEEVSDNNQISRIVTDHIGREVELPNTVERPIALTANLIEGLYNIGLEPVATVDNYNIREEAKELPSVGLQGNINIEVIYSVNPDLIIAHSRHQSNLISSLEETGIPVFVYDAGKAGTSPLYDSARFLGELLNRNEEAENYVKSVETYAAELKDKIAEKTNFKTALLIQDGDTITAAHPSTGYGGILTSLGLENIVPLDMAGSSSETFVSFDIESIIKADPDIILIRPSSNDKELAKIRLETYLNDPMWSSLSAVENGNIKFLPFRMHPSRATAEDIFTMGANTILSMVE